MRGLKGIALAVSTLLIAVLAPLAIDAATATPAWATTYSETAGGVAHTWTNYTNAGGTQGPSIAAYQTVQITCALTGFRVADGNTWWYQIASSPWSNQYYVSADAFYNDGQTGGSLLGTPFVDPAVPNCNNLGGRPETTGGVAHTWTDYTNAGGTQGPSIAAFQTVNITCALTGFRVVDGNTWWYQIASAPWSNQYYVSADAFYNNGQTSGSLLGTPFVDPAVPVCGSTPPPPPPPPPGITEQEGHFGVNTFQNYSNASGLGTRIGAGAYVGVSCKVYAPSIASVSPDGYWYLIASSPWNNQYYAPANTFMNGDPWGGPYSHNTDFSVPDCSGAPKSGAPAITLSQGSFYSFGYWYNISLSGFPANTTVIGECYDSVSPGGFHAFKVSTNGSGAGSTSASCISGDGPQHWVTANGVSSNLVAWGSGGGGGTSHISSPVSGNQGTAPPKSSKSTTCPVTQHPINCATGDFWHTFNDFAIPGRGVPLNFTHTYSSSASGTASRLGFGWTDSYNMSLTTNGTSVTVHEENGVTVTFVSDNNGHFTAPSYVLAALTSNSDGTYTFTRLPTQVHYIFSQFGQLISEVDRNGYATTLGYDSVGHLTSITDSSGRTLSLSYDGNQISQLTDPMGRSESFGYDSAGNLTSFTDANGGTWSFTYDTNHLMLTMTDPRGGGVTNVYDSSDRITSQTDAAGLVTTLSYTGDNSSSTGGTTTMTDPDGNVTVYNYQNLELMSVTHGFGTAQAATTSYTYDPNTLGITAVTDPNGHVTSYTYDAQGNLLTKTDALSHTTTYTYNDFNEPLTATDPLGKTTTYTYDANGNLLTKSGPVGDVTTNTYGDVSHPGDVTSTSDPDGRVTDFTYDTQDDVATKAVQRTNSITDTTQFVYDADGEQVCEASANAVAASVSCPPAGSPRVADTTTNAYDAKGEELSVTDANGHTTSYTYDGDGNRVSMTDPSNHTTSYTFDADNRLTKTTKPNGSAESTSYDGNDNATTTTDANGQVTNNSYDALNRLISSADPLGQTTSYSYDLAGNNTSMTNASGRVTSYGYDNASELTSISYSDGVTSNVTYTYDADGRRISLTDGTGTTKYSYDDNGRLTSVTNGSGAVVSYTYDGAGHVISITYPNSKKVTRTYDGAGNLVSVKDWLNHTTTFGYDGDANVTTQVTGSSPAVTDTFTYDPNDQLSSITDTAGSTTLQSFTYTRTPTDLVAAVTPLGAAATNYSYDPANQLTHDAQGPYAYDAAGNVTQLISKTPLAYNAGDELTTKGKGTTATKFSYDPEGERTTVTPPTGAATTYAYDQAGRLTHFTHGKTTASYAYNGDGLRTSKTVGTKVTPFTWDTSGSMPMLLSDGTTSYLYGPGGLPIESITKSGTVRFYHHDQLGSTTMLTSAAGTKVSTFTYTSYGTPRSGSGTNLRFGGQYRDAESGLYYLRARYYDPTYGRFLTVDPVVSATHTPYGYANDDPINFADPTGEFGWKAFNYIIGWVPVVGQVWGGGKAIVDTYKTVKTCNSDPSGAACHQAQNTALSDFAGLIPFGPGDVWSTFDYFGGPSLVTKAKNVVNNAIHASEGAISRQIDALNSSLTIRAC